MSLKYRLDRIEKMTSASTSWCPDCMGIRFCTPDTPPRPDTCPACGRGPGDYHGGGEIIADIVFVPLPTRGNVGDVDLDESQDTVVECDFGDAPQVDFGADPDR